MLGEPTDILPRLLCCLAAVEDWQEPVLEKEMRGFAVDTGASFGHCASLCRAALIGSLVGLPITLELVVFGKMEALRRIDAAIMRPLDRA